MIGLRWEDVDLAGLRLHVRRSVSTCTASRQERTTKGKRSRRVAISHGFAARLGDWRAASGGARATGYVWPGTGRRTDECPLPQPVACARRAPGGLGRRRRGAPGDPARLTTHGSQPDAGRRRSLDCRLAGSWGTPTPTSPRRSMRTCLAIRQLDEAAAAFSGLGLPSDHVVHDAAAGIATAIRPDTRTQARHAALPHG